MLLFLNEKIQLTADLTPENWLSGSTPNLESPLFEGDNTTKFDNDTSEAGSGVIRVKFVVIIVV